MKKISEGSVIRSGADGMVSYYSYAVSFFSWGYVLGGLLFSILMVILVVRMQSSKQKSVIDVDGGGHRNATSSTGNIPYNS